MLLTRSRDPRQMKYGFACTALFPGLQKIRKACQNAAGVSSWRLAANLKCIKKLPTLNREHAAIAIGWPVFLVPLPISLQPSATQTSPEAWYLPWHGSKPFGCHLSTVSKTSFNEAWLLTMKPQASQRTKTHVGFKGSTLKHRSLGKGTAIEWQVDLVHRKPDKHVSLTGIYLQVFGTGIYSKCGQWVIGVNQMYIECTNDCERTTITSLWTLQTTELQ